MNCSQKLIIVFLFMFFSFYSIADTLTLYNCQNSAIQNHPFFKNTRYYQQINQLQLKNIKSSWLPGINLNSQFTYQSDVVNLDPLTNFLSSINPIQQQGSSSVIIPSPNKEQYKAYLDINQVIYDGGAAKNKQELTKINLLAELQQIEVDLYKIKEQVNKLYFSLLMINKNVKLIEIIQSNLIEKQKVVQSAVKNGLLLESNLNVLEAEMLNISQQIAELNLAKITLISNLNSLTGEEYNKHTCFTFPNIEIADSIISNRPELKLFQIQKDKISATINLAHSQRMPKAYAFSQAGVGNPGLNMLSNELNSYYILGVGFKWNIYDWNNNNRERQILEINKNIINSEEENFNKMLEIGIENSFSEILKYESLLETDQQVIVLRQKITENYSSQLNNGVIKTSEYLAEVNAEKQAKINFELHKIQFEQAKIKYLFLLGHL